jgi:hypothetical protein
MANKAMNTTTCDSTGARWIGRKRTRSMAMPATKENAAVPTNATQYGAPHCMTCQVMKVENIAISPCAKFK